MLCVSNAMRKNKTEEFFSWELPFEQTRVIEKVCRQSISDSFFGVFHKDSERSSDTANKCWTWDLTPGKLTRAHLQMKLSYS